ncbi:MAG: radical SAM protein [Elusimicrobia bacterium]|nr:radical SAM protein [Elusimicrobiota bacterium]
MSPHFGFSCGWDIVHACDYRCPYCFFIPSWTTHAEETNGRHLSCSKEDWLGFWDRCFDQLGAFRIELAGGEPFQHPDIFPLVREISRRHAIHIVTNLSIDARKISAEFDPARVSLSVSFHPSHARVEELLPKLRGLKRAGFELTTSIVAFPAHFGGLARWIAAIKGEGARCYLNPFQGRFAGRDYPRSYTQEESSFLRANTFSESIDIRMRRERPRGRLCAAGWRYFRIWPDGTIHRCCATTELGLKPLGHIRDRVVPVLPDASPCPADRCFAPNELAMLIDA